MDTCLSLSRRNYLEKSLTQPFTSRYGTTPLMESERLVHATVPLTVCAAIQLCGGSDLGLLQQPRPYINIEHHDAWRRAQQQPPFFEGVAPRAGQHEVSASAPTQLPTCLCRLNQLAGESCTIGLDCRIVQDPSRHRTDWFPARYTNETAWYARSRHEGLH